MKGNKRKKDPGIRGDMANGKLLPSADLNLQRHRRALFLRWANAQSE